MLFIHDSKVLNERKEYFGVVYKETFPSFPSKKRAGHYVVFVGAQQFHVARYEVKKFLDPATEEELLTHESEKRRKVAARKFGRAAST